jgi:hypothetical protein
MPVDTTRNEMERKPYSPTAESLRVRCPSCRKLYLVQYADIQEVKPRFECVQCHSRFWLALSDMDFTNEIFGIPVQVKEAPPAPRPKNKETEPCPKCFKTNEVGVAECRHCGVVIEKYRNGLDFTEPVPSHSRTLEQLWRRVVADYANPEAHGEFIRACQRERNLAYAGSLYSQMRKLMPTDEETSRRLKEIQALGSVVMPQAAEKRLQRIYPRLWQVPLFVSTVMILVGSALPVFRNMVGVGAAILFIGVAMHLHFRTRH